MIQVQNISFHYPEEETSFALRDISFTLQKGERTVLMGANGSGKTTLVRILNGLLKPDAGDVLVDGFSVMRDEDLYEVRRRVGMAFQNPDNQIVSTTVEREIAFGLENLGIENHEMRIRVMEALKRFQLEPYRDFSPHILSGGERQRLAFASVWVMKPDYFILDEPTSLLDPKGKEEVFQFLEMDVLHRQTGILLVTQDSEEAIEFDRLLILHHGKLVKDGIPGDIFKGVDELHEMGLGVPAAVELKKYLSEYGYSISGL